MKLVNSVTQSGFKVQNNDWKIKRIYWTEFNEYKRRNWNVHNDSLERIYLKKGYGAQHTVGPKKRANINSNEITVHLP